MDGVVSKASEKPNYRIFSVTNQKGGVGKTTVACTLAEYFAVEQALRVLVIDIDGQANTSEYLVGLDILSQQELAAEGLTSDSGQMPPIHPDWEPSDAGQINKRSSIGDLYDGLEVLPYESFINQEKTGNGGLVDCICAETTRLEEINDRFRATDTRRLNPKAHNQLRRFLRLPSVREAYDVVIIDTPPSRSPIYHAAVRAATHLIVPFQAEPQAVQGLQSILGMHTQENHARQNAEFEKLELVGLFPNMLEIHRGSLHKKMMRDVFNNPAVKPCVAHPDAWITRSNAIGERMMEGIHPKGMFDLSPKIKAREQFLRFCQYVDQKTTTQSQVEG